MNVDTLFLKHLVCQTLSRIIETCYNINVRESSLTFLVKGCRNVYKFSHFNQRLQNRNVK